MSESIEFAGDDLARRVPLLAEFQQHLMEALAPLVDIAECQWANDAPADDEFTAHARESVRKMMVDYVLPAYAELGKAVNIQGAKMDAVLRIGKQTEDSNADVAGNWGGGGRHG